MYLLEFFLSKNSASIELSWISFSRILEETFAFLLKKRLKNQGENCDRRENIG